MPLPALSAAHALGLRFFRANIPLPTRAVDLMNFLRSIGAGVNDYMQKECFNLQQFWSRAITSFDIG